MDAARPTVKWERVDDLSPHPRNYRKHPERQLAHLRASIEQHGFYRNVVVARDGTILAGHGVVEAARGLEIETVPTIRLDVDPSEPRALKLLAADNELGRFAESDDRLLSELLREVRDAEDAGLFGTGYDDQILAGLVFATRNEKEIPTLDHAAEWLGAGMPEFDTYPSKPRVVVAFDSTEDRDRFMELIGATETTHKDRWTWSINWPQRPKEDLASLFVEPESK